MTYSAPPPITMTAAEAIAHIRRAVRCPEAMAVRQLHQAICNGDGGAQLPHIRQPPFGLPDGTVEFGNDGKLRLFEVS